MIALDQLAKAFTEDQSAVERLALFLGLDCTGYGCVKAIHNQLWELEFCSPEARAKAEREARL